MAGTRVACHVGQRLLDQTVNRDTDGVVYVIERPGDSKLASNVRMLAPPLTHQLSHTILKPQLIEHRRTQLFYQAINSALDFIDTGNDRLSTGLDIRQASAASQLNFRVDTFQNDQYAELPWIDNPNF
jgi:hypothetical protein